MKHKILSLMSGSIVAQLIPILFSPILTRLFSPTDFGVLALFTAIVTIISTLSAGRYEISINIPKEKKTATNIATLAFIINIIISIGTFFLIIILKNFNINWLEELGFTAYLIPITSFLMCSFNILTYYNIRNQKYKTVAISTVRKSISLVLMQLIMGWKLASGFTLVITQTASYLFANKKLTEIFIMDFLEYKEDINYNNLKDVGKEYIDFPKYSLPAAGLNSFSSQIIIFALPVLFSQFILGQYSLVQRILNTPLNVITNSFSQVFMEEASKEKNLTGNINKTFKKNLKMLLIIGGPLFLFLYFCGEIIVTFVFGKEWNLAGQLVVVLIPFFFARFITKPLTMTTAIYKMNYIGLIIQIVYILLNLFVIILALILKLDIFLFLHLYSTTLSLFYLLQIIIFYIISKKVVN